ncbi:MAG TPA: serine/threonine-protein kinase [Planctomycetota bacterium]|jgi:serine/threonine protein kinase|nr:serine/threonine-protein kinase [Planctomycetota bacterium]
MNTMKKCSTCGNLYSGDLCAKCMAGFAQKSSEPTAPPDDLPLKPGQTFHGLEIIELLGKGGMGVVYKARQPALDRLVALKILPQKMALDPDFQNRFIREAKALGSLSHPNIVAVYDFGAEGGLFFFAMEFVDGTNLRQVLRDRKLSPEQALKIVPQLCDALEVAHAEGVVHRDIKPENILLDKKGRVKIADFGLAKLVGADVAAANMLTVTNMVMGTPHYMAPEQVENPKSVDHRADIYAIGVVFYEMLTGELPIGRFELPSKKVQIDVRLDDVVLKALEKSPERRYQNASDVKEAVTKATAVTSTVDSYSPTVITPRPAEKKSKLPLGIGLAALAILAVVAICWKALSIPGQPKPPVVVNGPDPKAPVTPTPPAPVDLAPLYFGSDERPGGYVYQGAGTGLPRNPMPARDAAEIDILIKLLDGIDLQNIARDEIKQGYIAAWFRWEVAFAALETSIPERLEQQFLGLSKLHNKWSYRRGPLLVLAWAPRKEVRPPFAALVGMLQKKLGLPVETPDVPISELKVDRSDFPSEWESEPVEILGKRPGLKESHECRGFPREGKDEILVGAYAFDSAARAQEEEPRILDRFGKDAARAEAYRAGRTVLAFALRGKDVYSYEKTARYLREYMGYPERSMDTVIPSAGELPTGYSIATVRTDVPAILRELELVGVQASDVPRAWHAAFKPRGTAVLLEVKDSANRNSIETSLKKRGPVWHAYGIVALVEGSDDETLDALENRFREKFGYDANRPRPIHLLHARLKEAELPQGWTLGVEKMEPRMYSAELKAPNATLTFTIVEHRDYQVMEKQVAEFSRAPYALVLNNNLVVVQILGATEALWPQIGALEATLRKKMRLGPPDASEFTIDAKSLPKGCVFIERRDLGFAPNPAELKGSAGLRVLRERLGTELPEPLSAWGAIVDPTEMQIFVLQFPDDAKATEEAKRIARLPGFKQTRVYRQGPILGVLRSPKSEDPDFSELAELLRVKLRAPKE